MFLKQAHKSGKEIYSKIHTYIKKFREIVERIGESHFAHILRSSVKFILLYIYCLSEIVMYFSLISRKI